MNVAFANALSVPVPRVVPPSENVTVPVGVPEPCAVTVAVNVTGWPLADGLTEEVRAVVVAVRAPTCWLNGVLVLEAKVLSPTYCATIESLPSVSGLPWAAELVVNVACPDALSVAVPRVKPLEENVTVPVGVPVLCAVTVAVNVTDWP